MYSDSSHVAWGLMLNMAVPVILTLACDTQVGEVMDGRYEVRATHGKGVFSTVLLAKDRSQAADSPLGMVAIKVICVVLQP